MNSLCASRRARPLLGTLVEIQAGPGAHCEATERAFAAVERVHRLMSLQDPSSELSALNRSAHVRSRAVDPWTYEVLRLAQDMHRESGGVFDVVVGGRSSRHPSTSGDIELLPGRRVRYRHPLRVDLGGIAKGFAVDRAVDALREAGAPWGLVNAGGDMRAFGKAAHPVHLRLPQGSYLPLGSLSDGALASSTGEEHPPLGLPIVDGRGGQSIAADVASVFAACCATADALTKAVVVLGGGARTLLSRYGAQAVFREGGRWQATPAVD